MISTRATTTTTTTADLLGNLGGSLYRHPGAVLLGDLLAILLGHRCTTFSWGLHCHLLTAFLGYRGAFLDRFLDWDTRTTFLRNLGAGLFLSISSTSLAVP